MAASAYCSTPAMTPGYSSANVDTLGIDLARLDAVVISHRHGDHTSGLAYLLQVNPDVTIYVPAESTFFRYRPTF
jgi:metal-dependent hydrolase (beta-lactamase superfamily II)